MDYRILKHPENMYRLSQGGWVESKYSGKWKRLREHYQHKGYKLVTLYSYNGTKRKTIAVHSLMAQTFLDKPEGERIVIDHINHIRDDNRLENLRYITNRENLCRGKLSDLCGNGLPRGVSKNKNVFFSIKAFNNKTYFLGSFKSSSEAGESYLKAETEEIASLMHDDFKKTKTKNIKGYVIRGSRYVVSCRPYGYIGSFGTEIEAVEAYQKAKNAT